jgi:WD40 repeat protein/tRNA A-37 threonylcarbamoyl transferase component Bud32
MTAAGDRHLLLGLLALQNGIINQGQLVAAFQAWTLDKSKSLADLLEARGDLTASKRAVLEALAEVHLEAHGGDVERSLAAISAAKSTRESLANLGDPDIEATLGHVASAQGSTEHDGQTDADRTTDYSVGSATSHGQRFRVLRPHARGGLGAVFVALDGELNREVALKQMLDHHADDPTSRQRFLLEARVTGGLEHPGIVPVYGLGTHGDGRPYYAMRFIRGDSLKEAIDRFHSDETLKAEPGRRSLESRKLLRRFTDVCNAIDYAHSRGVLHRDIKPGNIIVGKHGETLVVDWGLAKATGKAEPGAEERTLVPSSASGSAETLPGSALGTPGYMSPEQAGGDLARLGPRSDVYSLGATLYCLLTGKPPFEGDDIGEVLRKVQKGDFVQPRQVSPSLDKALEAVCLKAMATSPEERYPSCRALAEDIERWMADERVSAWAEPWTRKLLRWLTRHRTGMTGAAAALLAGVVGLTAVLAVQTSAHSRLQTLATQEAKAREEAQTLATKEAAARGEAQALAQKEARARGQADEKAEQLRRQDYINRVNRAYREIQDDNIALAEDLLHGCPSEIPRGWEWHFVERLCNSERRLVDLGNTNAASLAYGPDGTWAVSGSGGQFGNAQGGTTVNVWDVNSGQRRRTLTGGGENVWDVTVSPDGKKVAAGCSAGLVRVWDMATEQIAWTRTEPGLTAMSVTFSPDGKSLAVGYGEYSGDQVGRVKLWDVASGTETKTFTGPRGGVNKVVFHPDGRRLAVAGSEVVEVWDLKTASKILDLKGHKKWVYCLAYSPDGKWLATGGWDRTVKLRDAATGVETLMIFAHEGFVLNLAFSPDSRNLVTTSEDRSVKLWEVPSGQRVSTFHGHADFVWAVAFRPDGREFGTGSADGSIRFWDLRTSRPVMVEHDRAVTRFAFRRDGLRVLSETWWGNDAIPTKGWNPNTGELDTAVAGIKFENLPKEFAPASGYQVVTAKSPDGKLVAQASAFGNSSEASRSKEYSLSAIIVREATSGQIVHTLTGHSAGVNSIAFSPDSSRLTTASDDRTIKFWDMKTGQDVFTLLGHTAGVVSVVFSPNGNQIVSSGYDATARVWNATPLASTVTAEHDARYQKKIETLAQLKATTDDSERAKILESTGQWGMASEALARAVAKEPDNIQFRCRLIDAILKSGDTSRIGPACDDMVKRFGNSGDPLQALAVAGLCRLASQAIADPEKHQAVHDMAIAKDTNERFLIQARNGHWDLISQSVAKIVEDKPDNTGARMWLLLSLLESGDIPGYRVAAAKILSQFRKASDPNSLNNAAWGCIYVPNAVSDLDVPVQMAEAAVTRYAADQKRFALNTLGAALYRAGRIDEAIVRLDESVKAGEGGVPQDWVFLAMAHYKKGKVDEARRWLEKVRAYVKDEKIGFSTELVEIRFLLKEAEALLRKHPPARP